jgi:hypothetical protein
MTMNRKTIIITIEKPGPVYRAWPTLRKLCKKHGFVYSTVIKKKLPTNIDNIEIHRLNIE